jgi:hypothetical protein
VVLAVLDVVEGEGAVRLRLGVVDRVALAVAELDGDAGDAEFPRLHLSFRPAAAGLEVAPDDAVDPALERLGFHRLLGVLRDLRHADRG